MNDLNKEQRFVVECLDENILLIAPAGTGKTNTLSVRIENIISRGKAEPNEILCLTFTNKAAKEMADRVEIALGNEAKGVMVKTIHSFCLEIIKEQMDCCEQVSSGFGILDEEDVKDMLYDIFISKYKKNLSPLYLSKVALVLEMMAKIDVYSRDNYAKADSLFGSKDYQLKNEICLDDKYNYYHNFYMFLRENLADIANEYELIKARENVVDFTDLIVLAYRILKKDKVLRYYRERFRFIHVDEMQDVSNFEYNLMEQLFCNNKVLMCGDICQTIYEWRGSMPKVILKAYEQKYQHVVVHFVKNYRSSKNILQAANGFLQKALGKEMAEDEFNHCEAVLDFGEKIVIMPHENSFAESRWIMDEIKALDLKDMSKVAILCRGNAQNNRISQEISKIIISDRYYQDKRMNFFLADEFRLFRRKEIKLALNFLKIYRNSRDEQALKSILKSIDYRVSARVIDFVCLEENKALGVGITDFIQKSAMDKGDYYSYLEEAMVDNSLVIFDVESTGVDVFLDDVIQIAAIKIDKNNNVLESFERFLIPRKSVGSSYEVHGFSDNFLAAKGEDAKVVFEDFLSFTKGCIVVGHNVFFDLSITKVNLHRLGLRELDIKFYYDTLELSRRFLKLPSYKLSFLAEKLNLKNTPDHNAMNDILATGELLIYLRDNFIKTGEVKRQKIYKEHRQTFQYIAYAYETLAKQKTVRARGLVEEIYKLGNLREIFAKEESRLKNLDSFLEIVDNLDDKNYDIGSAIGKILEYTALSNSQMDVLAAKEEKIPIITVHQSKGLEYDYIFLASVNERIFPTYRSVKDNKLLEEMKLFYVAMTRAKKRLYISSSGKMSDFVDMIPRNYVENGEYI